MRKSAFCIEDATAEIMTAAIIKAETNRFVNSMPKEKCQKCSFSFIKNEKIGKSKEKVRGMNHIAPKLRQYASRKMESSEKQIKKS